MNYPQEFSPGKHRLDDIRATLNARTDVPAAYRVALPDQAIEVWYGDPDRSHATVKHYHSLGTDKRPFDRFADATAYFIKLITPYFQ